MKKSLIIKISILLFLVVSAAIIIFHKNSVNADTSNMGAARPTFNQEKYSILEGDDGWFYAFEISYPKDTSYNITYMFDGYNLKYKELDGYKVPVKDEKGNILYEVSPNYITLSISKDHKSDIHLINDYFNEKQFQSTISSKDLVDLKLDIIDKDLIINCFNKAIISDMQKTPGKYYDKSFVNRISTKSTSKDLVGEWQLSYLNNFGYIKEAKIEFIFEDGTYLSDLAKKDNNYLDLLNNIKTIENKIISNQSYTDTVSYVKNVKTKYSINKDLVNLLNKTEEF